MINIKGVCVCKISMQGYPDFLDIEDLTLLKVQSEAGNVLPRMLLFFKMKDSSITKVLNEGNIIDIVLGTTLDAPDRIEASFKIVIPKIHSDFVELYCVHSSMKYTNTPSIEVFEGTTAYGVIKELAERSYKFESSLEGSEDEPMHWKKAFISDKAMVDEALLHLYLDSDVPLMGITEGGKFLLKSIDTLLPDEETEDYKIKITDQPKEPKDYPFDLKEVDDQRSLNNASSGYGRSKRVFDAETGTSKIIMYKPMPRLAVAAQLPKTSDVKMSAAQSVQKTENTHSLWEESEQKNKAEWDSLSSLSLGIYTHKLYIPVDILDLVMFEEHDETGKQIKDQYSGLYISTVVCRTISNKEFSTYIKLCRESTTSPEGEFELMSILNMLKGFLKNRSDLSKARSSALKSGFIQALAQDALSNLSLPGSSRYESQAIDDIIREITDIKPIVDDSVRGIYDNIDGIIDSGDWSRIRDGSNSGIKDFTDGTKDIDIKLDPNDYPEDIRDAIDDFNRRVPDPNILDDFQGGVRKEIQDTTDDLDKSIKDLGNDPKYSDLLDKFGSDPISGLGSPNDILDKWVC